MFLPLVASIFPCFSIVWAHNFRKISLFKVPTPEDWHVSNRRIFPANSPHDKGNYLKECLALVPENAGKYVTRWKHFLHVLLSLLSLIALQSCFKLFHFLIASLFRIYFPKKNWGECPPISRNSPLKNMAWTSTNLWVRCLPMVASTGSVYAENPQSGRWPVFEREDTEISHRHDVFLFPIRQGWKTPHPNGWKKMMEKHDVCQRHLPWSNTSQPRCSSRRMVTFSSPPKHAVLKRTEIRCWWVELDPGITKTIPPSFPPKNPPQSPHHPDTFIPKKTVVVDEGVHPRFLQPVFWFWK